MKTLAGLLLATSLSVGDSIYITHNPEPASTTTKMVVPMLQGDLIKVQRVTPKGVPYLISGTFHQTKEPDFLVMYDPWGNLGCYRGDVPLAHTYRFKPCFPEEKALYLRQLLEGVDLPDYLRKE